MSTNPSIANNFEINSNKQTNEQKRTLFQMILCIQHIRISLISS